MKLSEKIKCLFEQVNNLLTFKPQLDYNSETNTLTSVYINGKSASTLIEADFNPIEGSWKELEKLRSENKLIVGQKYILTDYQTKYVIDGTDSSDDAYRLNTTGNFSGYTNFLRTVSTDAISKNGDQAVVISLPENYTGALSVGDIVVATTYFNGGFIRFTPRVLAAGIVLGVDKVKYTDLGNNPTVLDDYGKPIIAPGGVINTDVHDSTPYMRMTAEENPTPPTERILLTAIDADVFSTQAESLTYLGDLLEFDFTDSDIPIEDANGVITIAGTRNGFILRREATLKSKNFTNKDWRVQRYRRYKIDEDNLEKYLHLKTQNGEDAGIYAQNGIPQFTSAVNLTEDHKYILKFPTEKNFYSDFTKINENPFLSGAPSADKILRISGNSGLNIKMDVSIPVAQFQEAKDFFITPIRDGESLGFSTFRIDELENTIIRNYGNSRNYFDIWEITGSGSVSNCTLMGGGKLVLINKVEVKNVVAFDYLSLETQGPVDQLINFAFTQLKNKGIIENFTIGSVSPANSTSLIRQHYFRVTSGAHILNSMKGGKRTDQTIIDAVMSHVLFREEYVFQSTLKGIMYFTRINSTNTGYADYQASSIDLNTFNNLPDKGSAGYSYEFNLLPSNTKLDNYSDNRELAYTKTLGNGNKQRIIISTPQ